MRFLKNLLPLLFILFLGICNNLAAQTAADLNGYTWKIKDEALTLLADAQKQVGANQASMTSVVANDPAPFTQLVYKLVAIKIEGNIAIPTAIVDGFQEAVNIAAGDPAYAQVSVDDQQAVFTRLVELIKE